VQCRKGKDRDWSDPEDLIETLCDVGGLDPLSLELAATLYGKVVVQVVRVSNPEVAEACKILENTYRAVNIALVNELKVLYDRMNIDIWEVIEAAQTKPFGYQAFYPGPGLGGHCIPPATPFTWPGSHESTASRPASLSWPGRSTRPCRPSWSAKLWTPVPEYTPSVAWDGKA
jgi:UDP-N-acetyl-D-glucosamine dehydrogenase